MGWSSKYSGIQKTYLVNSMVRYNGRDSLVWSTPPVLTGLKSALNKRSLVESPSAILGAVACWQMLELLNCCNNSTLSGHATEIGETSGKMSMKLCQNELRIGVGTNSPACCPSCDRLRCSEKWATVVIIHRQIWTRINVYSTRLHCNPFSGTSWKISQQELRCLKVNSGWWWSTMANND